MICFSAKRTREIYEVMKVASYTPRKFGEGDFNERSTRVFQQHVVFNNNHRWEERKTTPKVSWEI